MSKKEYVEEILAHSVKHCIVLCDNFECLTVIKDNDERLTEHQQTGNKDGTGLLDFCSESCLKRCTH
jgi:hypothetical protein